MGRLKIEKRDGLDPEIVKLATKVVSCLIGCAYKRGAKDEGVYRRCLQLVEQVLPCIRVLDTDSAEKYHTLLVNALCRCALFLAGECISYDSSLVREFCEKSLTECLLSSSIVCFQNISRNICKSIDNSCGSRSFLILDMLNITLKSSQCECKVGVVKYVNASLEFVAYCVNSIRYTSIDIRRGAAQLLHRYGGDFLQVSPSMASILFLYGTGLYFKLSNAERNDASPFFTSLDNGKKIPRLTHALDTLATHFDTSIHSNKVLSQKESALSFAALEPLGSKPSKHIHGNVSILSYLDALEYLCLVLVEHVNATWENCSSQERSARHSDNMTYVQDVFHQFCDFVLAAFECSRTSESDKERLLGSRKTLLQVAVSALKNSLIVCANHKKSLSSFKRIISSAWIEPQELKYLISALGNIGASLYNSGQLREASVALQLRCKTIRTHVKLLCKMYFESPKHSVTDGFAEDEIKSVIVDAFEKCAWIVDVLHKCHAANAHKIAVKSLAELSSEEDVFPTLSGSLALVKQWVKMLCKDFENVEAVEKAPYLYSLLLSRCSTWSKKTLGKILEQELLAYGLMESRNIDLCQKMQIKVIDTLLNDVLTTEEYNFQRSRILVKKARVLRARGIEGLNDCIKCLNDAISLLQKDIPSIPSAENALIYNQLALIYILSAQCSQEEKQDHEVILQNVHKALGIWSRIDIQGQGFNNGYLELAATSTMQLLCSIVDLLSMKGCWELQFGICKLIIIFLKRENVPIEKCLAILWSERRLNHSLCASPVNEDAILHISQCLDSHANSVDFWMTCLKDYPSYLVAFCQKFSLSDSVLPEVSLYCCERLFGTVTVDEVKKVASALIADVPLSSQSASIAGYLYYDLSERLFSGGHFFEALSHARMALSLRRKTLQRKFIYSFEHRFSESVASANQNRQDINYLEIIRSVATELWPDISKFKDLENSILTPWSVLRCYLESILQVGVINESIGNGAEAEVLYLTGKRLSTSQNLPIFQIAFTSSLGQLYSKNQFWELAESEMNKFGDVSRNCPEKGSAVQLSSDAVRVYKKALDKLTCNDMKCSFNLCRKTYASSTSLDKNNIKEAQQNVLNDGKRPPSFGDVRLPECSICSLTPNLNVNQAKQVHLENIESKGSNLQKGIKKSSRIRSKCLQKEQDLNPEMKPKTSVSKRNSRNKSTSAAGKVDNNDATCANDDISYETLSHKNSEAKGNGNFSTEFSCGEECVPNNLKCWRCLLTKAMVDGCMQNISYLKWECYRKRLELQLCLKIAKCKGIYCRKSKAHEVHDGFWQCISVMFNQNLRCPNISDSCLIELTQGEVSRDIFPLERAAILYNMSWFFLKDCNPEHSRTKCCSLANIQMPDIIPWIARAFILSRELPSLFEKVSKLLASVLLISTVDGPVSVPLSSENSISTSHWAAYFHQASLGTYLPCQYLACVNDKACYPKVSEDPCAVMLNTAVKASNYLRFAPEKLEDLEDFVREFFESLPSVPIVCISLLEGDYANLIGETLLLPSFVPAWMLLSRLNGVGQPISMLLPVDCIPEEVQFKSVEEWQCPWGYSVVDNVAPVFKQLLKENFLSSTMTNTSADAKINNINWWSQRSSLNDCLNKFLKSMEDSWLGPWACLLLGELSDVDSVSKMVKELINELELHCEVEANVSLLTAILGGSKSIADAEACISQFLLYKGYFGRGACCGKERLRVFSTACTKKISIPENVYKVIVEMVDQVAEPADREPVILVLDSDVQMLPWENLPTLRRHEVYRMPSVGSISLTLRRCSYYQELKNTFGSGFPLVNPLDSYYLLNPSGDLGGTQVEFEQWFRNQNWKGEAGKVPRVEELVLALQNHDLFLYFGHGSGMFAQFPILSSKSASCFSKLNF
ncbi:separase [Asparagus officinalis]|uniref:separase n=1 Tax=Asparagus officinalis TaxID=4686 RepID=UPI00098E1A3F|nr:separase [Asparagus officinalis]